MVPSFLPIEFQDAAHTATLAHLRGPADRRRGCEPSPAAANLEAASAAGADLFTLPHGCPRYSCLAATLRRAICRPRFVSHCDQWRELEWARLAHEARRVAHGRRSITWAAEPGLASKHAESVELHASAAASGIGISFGPIAKRAFTYSGNDNTHTYHAAQRQMNCMVDWTLIVCSGASATDLRHRSTPLANAKLERRT